MQDAPFDGKANEKNVVGDAAGSKEPPGDAVSNCLADRNAGHNG